MGMRHLPAIIAVSLVFIMCGEKATVPENGGQANILTSQEKAEGWKLLFDGSSFSGWRGLGRETVPEGHWTVENGMIRKVARKDVPKQSDGNPVPGGDLMTVETFEDFELVLEWRTAPGGNSGVKYNVSEEISKSRGSGYSALGFEYQVIDDAGYAGELNPAQTTGALYDLIPPGEKNLRPGEWNETRILVKGNHGEHWLNGKKVVEYEIGSALLDSLIRASKFRDVPDFGLKRKGHIILQDHADEAWYRGIRIRSL